MKPVSIGLIVALVVAVALPVHANQFLGGKGYLHTSTALLLPPGALDMSLYARGYTVKVKSVSGVRESSYMASNGTSALAISFGFTRRVELGLSQVLYQDLNFTDPGTAIDSVTGARVMVPGDTYLRLKWAGPALGEKLFTALIPMFRYRVARFHDVQMEPYEGIGIETGIITVLSYFEKPFYPDEALSVHLNLGYINHNDKKDPFSSSQSINYLISGLYPQKYFDFGLELYGWHFVKRPDFKRSGREDWMYICPFTRYKLFQGLNFTLGLDALVQGYKNTSEPTFLRDPANILRYPNYSKWRVTGKLSFTPSTAFYAAPTFAKVGEAGTGRERRTTSAGGSYDRQALFRWAVEGQGNQVEISDLDLMKIRQERMKAEEELKRLKKKLEEKQK